MTTQEQENFYRHSTGIVDETKDSFLHLLDFHLTNQGITLERFIQINEHEIYHHCYNRYPCCQCPPGTRAETRGSRVLHPPQMDILFNKTGTKLPVHNLRSKSAPNCCCPVNPNLQLLDLDFTLARFLLVNFTTLVPLGSPERNALDNLVKIRNESYGHAKEGKIPNDEYKKSMAEIEQSLLVLAKVYGMETETKQRLSDIAKQPFNSAICLQLQSTLLEQQNTLLQHQNTLLQQCGIDETIKQLIAELKLPEYLIRDLKDISVVEGNDARLELWTRERDVIVEWFKGDLRIEASDKYVVEASGQVHSLIVTNVDLTDRGIYEARFLESKRTANINIEEYFTKNMEKTFDCIEGDNVELSCAVCEANMPAHWTKNGVSIQPSAKYTIKDMGKSHSLSIIQLDLHDAGNYSVIINNRTRSSAIQVKDTVLQVILDATEFKGLLIEGWYEAYWNRIYLAGACNIGKTTLASLLIGEDIPKHWNSTDGLRIYFGRNGIDLNQRKMIPLKEGLGRGDVLSKVLRGKPNIKKTDVESIMKHQESPVSNIVQDFAIVSPKEVVCSSSAASLFDTNVSFGVQTTSCTPPKKKKKMERKLHTRKLSRLEFTSVHEDIKQELRKGEYKMEVAPSDLVDFGGQRSYDMTHQLFIQSKGAFTLLFDGRKGLQDPLIEEYPQGDVTSESILKHWVDSILTYCGSRDDDILPIILFVATHSDWYSKDQQIQKTAEFKEGLCKLFSNHHQHHRILYNDVFFINGTDKNDAEVDRLKSKYVDIAFQQKSWGKKMPMAWVPLELQLSEMRTNNISIISKDELIDINRDNDDLALTEKQLDQFLKAQHALGKILYFENYGLQKYVIVQPTSLVDILRSFITDEMFWSKEESLNKILQEMTETGKIRKTDLFRLWSQDEFNLHMPDDDFKEFVLQVLIHLDLLVEPKRYIHSPHTDFFLVPCVVKRGPTDDFINSPCPREDNIICLSYKLLKSPIPSAFAFKLIGAVLNVWPLKETHQGICLYHKAAILCIDQSNEMYLWVKDDRVQVYLLNTTSKHLISKDFASCAQECLTLTITSSLEFYHRSFGNFVSKSTISDLFEIEVGERCEKDICYISLPEIQQISPLMKDSWTCKKGRHHATYYPFYWIHDKKQKECHPDCAGLDKNCLQLFPGEKHLARLSSYIGIKKFDQFIISLGMSRDDWESVEYKYQRADVLMMKIDALCQMKKKVSNGPSFQDFYNALIAVSESSHILCQIFREDRTILDIDNMVLQAVPDDKTLKELSRNMGNCASHLGIELGINIFEIEATIYKYYKNMFEQNYDILKKWRKAPHGNKTIRILMHALCNVDRRGCEFLKNKYKIVY